jgi:predicted nucleic acid-binding protein
MAKILVDTNIFIYIFKGDLKMKAQINQQLREALNDGLLINGV